MPRSLEQPIDRILPLSPTADSQITPADEAYSHQLVAPAARTQHADPAWAERCYHLLHIEGATILHTGRAVHPHAGRSTAFAGVTDGSVQHALRVAEPFGPGDDPSWPAVGPIRIEVARPLHEIRLVLDAPGFPFAFDLRYVARFPPVRTEPNRIERDDVVVTEYMNFFQSGSYSGGVSIDGTEYVVHDRFGFRDRGWGLRKHEGAPRRGLVVACFCELPDEALYAILYETASGRRVFTNGWRLCEGETDLVTAAEHELEWDGTLLAGGRFRLLYASGGTRTVELEVLGRLFLSAAGYSADPGSREPGQERFDVTRPEVVAALDGQNDNACRFVVDGVEGHGYVETGLGGHARYRPESGSVSKVA